MKRAFPLLLALALPLIAVAGYSALRLVDATPPDWRGEGGLVFAADSATLAFDGDGAGAFATVRRAPDAPPRPVALAPDPAQVGRWLLQLPERGWYDVEIAGGDLSQGSLRVTAAVVGAPIPEAWRTNSVFGIWNVHGDTALIRLAGARWNRRMTAFHSVTEEEAALHGDLSTPPPVRRSPDGTARVRQSPDDTARVRRSPDSSGVERALPAPYIERDGLRQVGVFSFGLPPWTMDIPEGVKKPSFGSLFYPARNWDDVARAVAAYARTHALPRDFSIYNEPLAHFKGKPIEIADYARAVRKGLKAADPSFRIGGPGLYSIRIRDLNAIEAGGLLESLDFLDLHAYVGGTPPEDEFIRKIEMLNDWLAAHGRPEMPVYLTEFGWTAAAGTWQPPVDRATQARYVARSLALAWSQGVDALIYFALEFRTKKEGEAAFSLIGPGGRPEAGYCAFAAVSRHFAASEPLGRFSLAPGVHMVAGRRDGRLQLMLWCEDETPSREVVLPFAASACDLFGSPIPATAPLRISPSPVFLEIADVADVAELSAAIAAALPPAPMPQGGKKRDEPPPLDIWPDGATPQPAQREEPPWKPFGDSRGKDGKVPDADCAANVRLRHSGKGLAVEVEVLDDEHRQTNSHDDPSQMWAQDSVQIGIDMDWGKPWEAGFAGAETSQTLGGHRVFEFSVGADGRGGGKAYLEQSWDDALPMKTLRDKISVAVKRDEATRKTRYRILIPWAELGAAARPPRPGEAIGFSLAVNDVDPGRGAPRHGVALFGGIVNEKEPKLFGPAWLRP
jgi:hypothetical protein